MSNKKLRIPLNLQFFAEGEGEGSVNTPEVAEPEGTETTGTEGKEVSEGADVQTEEKTPQSSEVNAQYAAARRQAEQQIRARDKEFATRFGHIINPVTGRPIQSEKDYFEALDAQNDAMRRQQLESQGIDTKLLDELIANNPTVRQAQLVMEQSKQQEELRQFEADLQFVHALDPTVNTIEDLLNMPNSREVLNMVDKGYSLPDAFKLANWDKLTQQSTQASKQAAINALRSKSHMTPTDGVSDTSTDVDIPQSELASWKNMFPHASDNELKAKYNKAIKVVNRG